MFGREMTTKIPEWREGPKIADEQVRDRDWENKLKAKAYADENRQAVVQPLKTGDKVLVKQPRQDKMTTNFSPEPYEITNENKGKDSMTVRNEQGQELERHKSFLKRYEQPLETTPSDTHSPIKASHVVTPPKPQTSPLSRPQRNVQMPNKFKDFVLTK